MDNWIEINEARIVIDGTGTDLEVGESYRIETEFIIFKKATLISIEPLLIEFDVDDVHESLGIEDITSIEVQE